MHLGSNLHGLEAKKMFRLYGSGFEKTLYSGLIIRIHERLLQGNLQNIGILQSLESRRHQHQLQHELPPFPCVLRLLKPQTLLAVMDCRSETRPALEEDFEAHLDTV